MAEVYFKGGKIQISTLCFDYAKNMKDTKSDQN